MKSKNDLEKQVLLAARDTIIASVSFRNAAGKKLKLNITDYECLSYLTIHRVAAPTELARYTGLTSGAATVMLDRLEDAGFIRRRPNPVDRRGVIIEIDPHYQEMANPLVADMQKAHWELLAGYSEQELKVIADFLTRFTENVRIQTEKIAADISA